jgi:hypothetical protein
MFCTGDGEVKQAVKKAAADAQEPLTQEAMDALAQQELERRLVAAEIEARRKRMVGQAAGNVVGHEVDLASGGKRSVGTYTNPLKGKFAGLRMSELPDFYLHWAVKNPGIRGWPKTLFRKEIARREKVAC